MVVSLVVIWVSPYVGDADDTFITPVGEESEAIVVQKKDKALITLSTFSLSSRRTPTFVSVL